MSSCLCGDETKNLLTLAIEYMGDPDRGMDYFDQSFVHKVNNKEDEEGEENPVIK
jgi:hypothetical protein